MTPLGNIKGQRGISIDSIERTSGNGSAGTTDVYTIVLDNGETATFSIYNGANGRAISSVTRTSGTGAAGTTDTYTITFSDNTTTTFPVVHGANGDVSLADLNAAISGITKTSLGLSNVDNTSDADKPVSTAAQTALDAKSDTTHSHTSFTGLTVTGLKETSVAMGANNIDLATGNLFTKTISGATTLTVSNVPASGTVGYFILQLTNGGSATVTWFSGVRWAGGTAPTLTASGKDILSFYTIDAGTTWNVVSIQKDVK